MLKRRSGILLLALLLLAAFAVLLDRVIFPLPTANLRKPSATFVYARDRSLLGCFASRDGFWRKPVALSEISPLLQKSAIATEDRFFYYHPGVNLVSLFSAAIDNVRARRVVRGGSTITMQVARMMEPKRRTMSSKIIEVLRAFQLEAHFSKREILEIYFNLAPYGGNIEGVGAASYFYFEKRPIELSASQAALLTSIPNSPTALRPDVNFAKSLSARDKVLGVMKKRGIISEEKYREALAEEIRSRKTEPPQAAPHFARDLAGRAQGRTEIVSTLDRRIQNVCDGAIRNHKRELALRGIQNAAAVVMKNSTGEILGLVGSSDFYDVTHQGQVNGAASPRSPGSALKPFAYALALDKGILTPNTILEDLPVYYSGYSPENYDRKYRGAVTAADALRLSLNVPAVATCARAGHGDFYRLLKTGGLTTLNRPAHEYGLPLILGSCEVRLVDLAALYGTLARGGVYIPFRTDLAMTGSDTIRLFSPGASYIVSEILSELERPDFPSSWEFSPNIPKVAWKTGTSYGRRDAWSVGYNPEYTVGVWVGNFTGESSPDLVGAEAAAPLLFEIFQAIGSGRGAGWFTQPPDIATREICAISGLPPGPFCPVKITGLYIPEVSPSSVCDIHKEILVDSLSGVRLCRYCQAGKKVIQKVYEDWPPKLATYLAKAGQTMLAVPKHNPACTGAPSGDRPVIISPNADAIYIVRPHLPLQMQQIPLEASAAAGQGELFWFIDGELFGKAGPGRKLFYTPSPGTHRLVCSDGEGRSSSIMLKIE